MVTAALISFGLLLVAWIAAPDRPPAPTPHALEGMETDDLEARPLAA